MPRRFFCFVVFAAMVMTGNLGFAGNTAPSGCISVLDYDARGTVIGRRLINCDGRGKDRSVAPSQRPAKAGSRDRSAAMRPARPHTERADIEPGELVVANPPRRFLAGVRRDGYRLIEGQRLPALSMAVYRLRTPPAITVDQAAARLRRQYPGLVIDANQRYETAAKISRSRNSSRARAAIGWPPPGERCGKGIRVGMIDAAVDLSHPALVGRNIEYRSFHGPGRVPGPAEHGTAIAALIAGNPADRGWGGLLPNVEIKAANMFEKNGSGKVVGNAMGLFKAMNWILSERVHVLNLSIAGSDNKVARMVFDKANTAGLVMVAAAGNWGRSDRPAFPAAYSHVLAITAVGSGHTIYDYANSGGYIDFAAPGVRLWTAVPGGGRYQSGTSFAAPFVSVLTAVEVFHGAKPNAVDIRRILRQNVLDLGEPGRDDVFGWGFVNKRPACGA